MTAERPVPPGWERAGRLVTPGSPSFVIEGRIRDALRRIADATDGLDSCGTPAQQEAYRRFVFPYDAEAWGRIASDQLSACALVGAAVLDCLGYESEQTDTGYQQRVGRAVSDLVQLGIEADRWLESVSRPEAWVDLTSPHAELPDGPFVGLCGNNAGEGLEHVFVGLEGVDEGRDCPIVEGGQLSKIGKGFRIARGVYHFDVRAPGNVWVRRTAPSANAFRRLRAVLLLDRLPYTQEATLPAIGALAPGANR